MGTSAWPHITEKQHTSVQMKLHHRPALCSTRGSSPRVGSGILCSITLHCMDTSCLPTARVGSSELQLTFALIIIPVPHPFCEQTYKWVCQQSRVTSFNQASTDMFTALKANQVSHFLCQKSGVILLEMLSFLVLHATPIAQNIPSTLRSSEYTA